MLPRHSNLANDTSDMRIFERRYFNINRRLLMCLGLWPYEVKVKKIVLRAITIGTLMLLIVPRLISIRLHYKNMDRLMLNVLVVLSILVGILKVIGMIVAEKNMIKLHKSIADNWQSIQDESERDLLHKYAERARTVSIFYGAAIGISCMFAGTLPLLPKLLDIVSPLEYSRPVIDLLQGEYFIDRRAYLVPLFCIDYFAILISVTIAITVDTMYIVSVEHCCTLFEIIRNRLLKLKRIVQKSSTASGDDGADSYERLRRTVQLHQDALIFTSLLRDSYSLGFLLIMVAALFIWPLASCAIIANIHDLLHLLPYAIYYMVLMINGIFFFYPGQRIIDHQLSLLDAAYYNEWYTTPLRTRKILLIFMLRCSEPTTLTAGDLLPINFEVYFKLLKTTLSYITVASSFR